MIGRSALVLFFCLESLPAATVASVGKIPLVFEANEGQADGRIKYMARGPGYSLLLAQNESVLTTLGSDSQSHNVRIRWAGTAIAPKITGEQTLSSTSNYLIGANTARHLTGVRQYGRVKYQDLYPGIDLLFYGSDGELEFDFVVAPGADPEQIRFRIDGAERVIIDEKGDLVIQTSSGSLRHKRPTVFQREADGRNRPVDGGYRLAADGQVSFAIAAYDRSKPLVIDPVLQYTSLFGGKSTDVITSVALDPAGRVVAAGYTISPSLPGSDLQGQQPANLNAFVTRFNAKGTSVDFTTYLGGSGTDISRAVTVDADGNIYVAGETDSRDFPVRAALKKTLSGGKDAFLTKIDPTGKTVLFSTYLGGSSDDEVRAIALDTQGNVLLAGATKSVDLPKTASTQRTNRGGTDAFVAKVRADGTDLLFCTYLGGSGLDIANAIASDPGGSIYVAGQTSSTDFPTAAATQPGLGGNADGFLTKLTANGIVEFSSFLGGSGADNALGVAVDSAGAVVVTGSTSSEDFPTVNAWKAKRTGNGDEAFVAKFAAGQLAFSTLFGGSGNESGNAIGLDPDGNIYVAGTTTSTDLPVQAAIQPASGGDSDAFLAKFSKDGQSLLSSTYLGGAGPEQALGLAVNRFGLAYLAGSSASSNLTSNAGQKNQGEADGFVAAIHTCELTAPKLKDIAADGGSLSIDFQVSPECSWNASALSTWLHLTVATTGRGASSIKVQVEAAPMDRNGQISINDQLITIHQTAPAVVPRLAHPSPLRDGFDSGTLGACDDSCSLLGTPGFSLNFFGTTYTSVWVNNNGNVTFGSSLPDYVSKELKSLGIPIIAPFWADVYTYGSTPTRFGSGFVNGRNAFGVTWDGVGGYLLGTSLLNSFQVILIQRADRGVGDFDIEFNYNKVQWDTTSAGGIVSRAFVGYSDGKGDAGKYLQFAGSGVSGQFLDGGPRALNSASLGSAGVSGRYVLPVQNGSPCLIQPQINSALTFSGIAQTMIFSIAADPATCAWTVTSDSPWLTVSPASGSGPGQVALSVTANSLQSPRYGLLTVGGQTISVTQNPLSSLGCTFALTPSSVTSPASGSASSFNVSVTGTPQNCSWTAVSDSSWLTVTSGGNGIVGGTVQYSVEANTTNQTRNGRITIADKAFVVTQPGTICTSPDAFTLTPSTVNFLDAASTGTVNVQTATGCNWSATSNQPWLQITSGGTGGGNGTVRYSVSANPPGGVSRSATITVGGKAMIVNQSSAANCTYSVSTQSLSFPAGQFTINPSDPLAVKVTTGPGCTWSATSNAGWLFISQGGGIGGGSVAYTVFSNPGAQRNTTLTIAGRTVNVVQQAPGIALTCAANGTSAPTVRVEGNTELTGDMLVACTGTTVSSVITDVILKLNTSITSRTDAKGQSETLLFANGVLYRGLPEGYNQVRFPNVVVASAAGTVNTNLRFTNIRANANLLGVSNTSTPTQIIGTAIFKTAPVPSSPSQTLANISKGVATSIGALGTINSASVFQVTDTLVPVTFTESFAAAFKKRGATVQDSNAIDSTESGLSNVPVYGNKVGYADTGTRLLARIANVPPGVRVYAPVYDTRFFSQLVSQDPNGAGGTFLTGTLKFYSGGQGSDYQEIFLTNGGAVVAWEVLNDNPSTIEASTFNLIFERATGGAFTQTEINNFLSNGLVLGPQLNGVVPQFLSLPSTLPAPAITVKVFANTTTTANASVAARIPTQVVPPRVPSQCGNLASNWASITTGNPTGSAVGPATVTGNGGPGSSIGQCLSANPDDPGACTISSNSFTDHIDRLESNGTATTRVEFCGVNSKLDATSSVGATAVTDAYNGGPAGCSVTPTEYPVPAAGEQDHLIWVRGDCAHEGSIGPSISWIHWKPFDSQFRTYVTFEANTTGITREETIFFDGYPVKFTQVAVGNTGGGGGGGGCTTDCGALFVPVAPCRITDTRLTTSMTGASSRDFIVPQSGCPGIPSTAKAYSLNFTVVPKGPLAYLTAWPTGQTRPNVSTLNADDGRVLANAAIVPAGSNGAISVFVSNPTDVIIDINGYFDTSSSSAYYFYSAAPCRVADTRNPNGPYGGPAIGPNASRDFSVYGVCGIPSTAKAYSMNFTVVPTGPLGYLTTWPAGTPQPLASTLNSGNGAVVANAAIVPAGATGGVSVFANSASITHVLFDVNGYFAAAGGANSLKFYAMTPCRVADTRPAPYGMSGPFGPPTPVGGSTRNFPILSSACGVPSTAQAYAMNVTVVPQGPLSYLTMWPMGSAHPLVSTLNAPNGNVLANAAIVPAGQGGAISVFVTNTSDVILDITGYFAP